MKYRSQTLVLAAALTVALVSAAYIPSKPFVTLPPGPQLSFNDRWVSLLEVSPLPQIDVPLGMLPAREMPNLAFGTERGRISWIAEEHADTLSIPHTGRQPLAWPDSSSKGRCWMGCP